eukprot:6527035-Prymnesium_polylepis.1
MGQPGASASPGRLPAAWKRPPSALPRCCCPVPCQWLRAERNAQFKISKSLPILVSRIMSTRVSRLDRTVSVYAVQ